MELTPEQFGLVKEQFKTLKDRSAFYAEKFADIDLTDVQTQEDFEKLPFSEKDDLRRAYPLGLQAVPDEEVVRIHSSSGTTGTPVIIPYTVQDVVDWAVQFARCYETAGITNTDRIQITPGYGLWTAGIGFQLGAERLGAMAVPMGPGNTEKQLKMMQDLKSTVLCATSSYALLLAEEIAARLGQLVEGVGGSLGEAHVMPPFLVEPDSPVIQALLNAYNEATGEDAKPFTMGGGTYARKFSSGASFGPEKPWIEDPAWVGLMHGPDEGVSEELLKQAFRIYALTLDKLMRLDLR